MRRCFASGSDAIVRMLCSRSASLISRTRMSLAIATSILRSVAACCASLRVELQAVELGDAVDDRRDLVCRTRSSRSSSVIVVSSTASWSSAPRS